MCSSDALHLLIKRVHQTFDPLLMKLLRNLAEHPPAQEYFQVLPSSLTFRVCVVLGCCSFVRTDGVPFSCLAWGGVM